MRSSDLALISVTRADLVNGRARGARESAGINQTEMASALGVTRQAVSHWETGRSSPSAAHALAYGRLLRQLAKRAA
jgi:DNA-binding XRE family transcriptional regulator